MTDRALHALANAVACPFCEAAVGQPCKSRSGPTRGAKTKLPHNRRLVLARRQPAREDGVAAVVVSLEYLRAEVRMLRNEMRVLRRAFGPA